MRYCSPLDKGGGDFCTLAAESRWNETALKAIFWPGLKSEVCKEIACRDDDALLDSLIDLAIQRRRFISSTSMPSMSEPEPIPEEYITFKGCVQQSKSKWPTTKSTIWLHF